MADYIELWAVLHLFVGNDVEDAIVAEAARRGLRVAKLKQLRHAGNDLMDAVEEDPGRDAGRARVTALAPRERRTVERIRKAIALLRTDPACDSLREFMRRTRFDYHTLMKYQDLGLIDLSWVGKAMSERLDIQHPQVATGEAQVPPEGAGL